MSVEKEFLSAKLLDFFIVYKMMLNIIEYLN